MKEIQLSNFFKFFRETQKDFLTIKYNYILFMFCFIKNESL